MAPEQILGDSVDARVDLYALGCILYELLIGHPPFCGEEVLEIIQGHLHETVIPPSQLRTDLIRGRSLEALLQPLQFVADRCLQRGFAETEELLGRRGKILAMYEPSLASLPGQEKYPEPADLSPQEARTRLFSDLSKTFRKLAKQQPLAILIDDLQWADELVLGFFRYELRTMHFENVPFIIVGTYRSEAVQLELKNIIETPGVETIRLNRLREPAINAIIGDMLGMWPPPELFCRYLFRKSEGNPLFVSEYLRVAIDTGLLYIDGQGNWHLNVDVDDDYPRMDLYEKLPIPTSLQGLIEKRLIHLSTAAKITVQAAAIIGRNADFLLLWQMTKLDDTKMLEVVDELIHYQIMEQRSQGAIQFSHARIREVTLARMEASRIRKLHHLAAESIEILHHGNLKGYYAELGFHWEQADVPDKARLYYLSAAREARTHFDYRDALRFYNAHLNLVEIPDQQSLNAILERADIYDKSGQYQLALDDYETLYMKTEDESIRASCLRKKASILYIQGDVKRATEIYYDALKELSGETLEHVKILNDLAFTEINMSHDYEKAEELCQQANQILISLFPKIAEGDKISTGECIQLNIPTEAIKSLSRTLKNFGVSCHARGEFTTALEYFGKSLCTSQEIRDMHSIGDVLDNMGLVNHDLGNLEKALEYYQKYLKISEEIGFQRAIGIAAANIALLYRDSGELEDALHFFHYSRDISRDLQLGENVAIELSEIYHLKGDSHRAYEFNNKALQHFEDRKQEVRLGDCWCVRAELDITRGDIDAAIDSLSKAKKYYRQKSASEYSIRLPITTLRLEIEKHRRDSYENDEAKIQPLLEQARSLYEKSKDNQWRYLQIEAMLLYGIILSIAEHHREAREKLASGLDLASKHGFRLLEQRLLKESDFFQE